MLDAIKWLLVVEVIGLAALPLVYAAFPFLSDRGWGFARPIGILLVGFGVWILSYAGALPNSAWAWWLITVIIAAAGIWWAMRRWAELSRFVRTRWRQLVVGELLFLGFFVAFALLRAHDPNISGTEKPMEIMLLNASTVAGSAPPIDPWLSGEPVAYYYFGYWNLGGLAAMSGVSNAVGFNLSLALIAGMSAIGIYSLVFGMVRSDGATLRPAMLTGVASAFILLIAASLAGWWELAAHAGVGTDGFYDWLAIEGLQRNADPSGWRPDQFWWWFRASRVINTFDPGGTGVDFTIQEFPAFSLVLGDLHPHVIAIPFVIAGLAAAFNLLLAPGRWGLAWLRANRASTVVLVLLMGSAGFINAWDTLILPVFLIGVVGLKMYRQTGDNLIVAAVKGLRPLAVIGAVAVAIFIPYYFLTSESQVSSPFIAPAEFGSRPIQFLTVWGVMLALSGVFVGVLAYRVLKPQWDWWRASDAGQNPEGPSPIQAHWVIPAAATAIPFAVWAISHLVYNEGASASDVITRLYTALPLSLVFIVLVTTLASRTRRMAADATQFALLGSAIVVYLIYGAELFFVNDMFGGRMNTVFKFYYQSWIILAAVSAYGLYRWRALHVRWSGRALVASRTAAVGVAVILIGPLWYPVAAAVSKVDDYTGPTTLDGLAYIESGAPNESRAIEFLKGAASGDDTILEAVGGSYTDHARISGSTGLSTVLGWPGHERQWRGLSDQIDEIDELEQREQDVEQLYTTEDDEVARGLIERYGVKYVVVGDRERIQYPTLSDAKFDTLGTRVFDEVGMTIFRVRDNANNDD